MRGAGFILAAAVLGLPPAFAQDKKVTHYDAQRRAKVGIETCMKDEVLEGAWCIKKCQPDFRLDVKSNPPLCIAVRPNAKYLPPHPPGYTTPEKAPPPAGKGA